MAAYLEGIKDFSKFDMRETAVMPRAGGGGENMWIYDNAYGPERDVLPVTLFTTPRIHLIYPAPRQVRTMAERGRGGPTNAVLQHLRDEVAVDVDVEVAPGLQPKSVTIDFVTPNVANLRSARTSYVRYQYVPGPGESRRLYEGATAPKPGSIVLDTRTLPNGLYGLTVTAEDSRGIKASQNTFFGIVNARAGDPGDQKAQPQRRATPEPKPVPPKAKSKRESTQLPPQIVRTWTDRTGTYRVEAEFLSYGAGEVKLRKSSGEVLAVPIERLSDEDQHWVRRRAR